MGQAHKVEVTSTQIERAENMWHSFVKAGKFAVIATCIIVALLGLVFIDW